MWVHMFLIRAMYASTMEQQASIGSSTSLPPLITSQAATTLFLALSKLCVVRTVEHLSQSHSVAHALNLQHTANASACCYSDAALVCTPKPRGRGAKPKYVYDTPEEAVAKRYSC